MPGMTVDTTTDISHCHKIKGDTNLNLSLKMVRDGFLVGDSETQMTEKPADDILTSILLLVAASNQSRQQPDTSFARLPDQRHQSQARQAGHHDDVSSCTYTNTI